jgi:aminopeptidase
VLFAITLHSFKGKFSMPKTLAETVVNTTLGVKPDETVVIDTWQHTLPLASELAYQVRKAGGLPLLTLETDDFWWKTLTEVPTENLRKPLRHSLALFDQTDAAINIFGPEDPHTYRSVEGRRMGALFESFQKTMDRIRERKVRSVDLQVGYVTEPRAKTYGFNYDTWKRTVEEASNADYEKIAQLGKKLARTLEHAKQVEVTNEGTKVRMEIGRHPVLVEDGIIDQEDRSKGFVFTSIPSGYVTLAPKRGSTEGSFHSDMTVPIMGQLIKGISWEFQKGRLVKAAAEANHDAFQKIYDPSSGDKDQVASLSIGLNHAVKPGFLADYMSLGTVTIGIGENQALSGENQSTFQFQASLSKATVTVDGQPIVHNGKLTI